MIYLLSIMILIIFSFLLRKEIEQRRGIEKSVQIMERIQISPRQQLLVVTLDGAKYLVGTGTERISILPLVKIEGDKR